jgi:molybdenum cofactor cytidylyltransferase
MKLLIAEPLNERPKIGAAILAAGASVRMGRPKQLLLYRGKALIRRAVEAALASVCHPVVVVIGAHAGPVKEELEGLPVLTVDNRQWGMGMVSSIRSGLGALVAADPESEGAVIMLCDQPFVDAGVINRLADARRETGKNIVASEYGGARGVPVFFGRELFAEIASLDATEGARRIIGNHPHDVATVSFPGAAVDIDTPYDYALLTGLRLQVSGTSGGGGRPGSLAGEK